MNKSETMDVVKETLIIIITFKRKSFEGNSWKMFLFFKNL